MSRRITPAILSGGSGTRLWPLSRDSKPKQLLSLTHDLSMLQLTVGRCGDDTLFNAPIIVASALHADAISQQMDEVGCTPALLILEPMARNTAPAIGLAALAALEKDEDAILLVMPSDHTIDDVEAFRNAVTAALPMVEEGYIATFGITPHTPETGYGYILMGDELAEGVRHAEAFVEKPDYETACAYLKTGNYVWNGGIFLFRADTLLASLANHAPDIAEAVRKSMDAAGLRNNRLLPEPTSFARSPSQSIDYAVMEKEANVVVVPTEMGWSDVGSWDALHDLLPKDEFQNVVRGDVIALESSNCLIYSSDITVTATGLQDLIIVASEGAVTILPRGKSQDVRKIVEALKKRALDDLK